jgi:GNAT superfamily N-acetyltransferase
MTESIDQPFTIRTAGPSDCELLLTLINELAEYEKLAHEVVATPEVLQEGMFGSTPYARAIIAENQGEPVGYALYFHSFSTFTGRPGLYLEDIYVIQAHRGKGIGKMLMSHVAKVAIEKGCSRMEWSVLNWNTPSIDFYRAIGAQPMEGWTVQRLVGDALKTLAGYSSQ